MKYKNYRNPYTNDNRIYSFKDLYDMPFGELIRKKQEVLGQYRVLGVPREEELQSSENVVHVEAYTRDDGTEVKAHWRSKPDGVASNNFSHGTPTGGASNISINNIDNIFSEKMNNANNVLPQELTSEINNINKQNPDAIYEKLLINLIDLSIYQIQKETAKTTQKAEFIRPVEGKITSDYGLRPAPVVGASTNHTGIDIGVPIGTPVKAIADGTVVAANGGMQGYGNGVFIEHKNQNNRVRSEYGHLSKWIVKPGQKVKQGQVIGYSGNTGRSKGAHLHLTIREYDSNNNAWQHVNPLKYVKY